jgi:hypothetical protein
MRLLAINSILQPLFLACFCFYPTMSTTATRSFLSPGRRLAFCGSFSSTHSSSCFGITTTITFTKRERSRSRASNNEKTRFFSSSSTINSNKYDENNNSLMSVELLADQLAKSKYNRIIALVGAGASCSAGIPDFRTPGSGLYDQLQHYDLPFPEAIFDLDYYQQNPLPFIHLCKEIWPGQQSGPVPTLSHTFLKLLEDKQINKI